MSEVYKALEHQIETICDLIKEHKELYSNNEEQVKINLIIPILNVLGWNTQDPSQVRFETSTEGGGRIDIVLKKDGKDVFLIEVKNLSKKLSNYLEQVGKYMFDKGIPKGALSNGREWVFIKAWTEGKPLSDRIIETINICNDSVLKVISILECLSSEKLINSKIA